MNTEKAAAIDGWMEPVELSWLAFEARRHKVIVEIGSYAGRSSRVLADNTEGLVYCVDDWFGPREFEPEIKRAELYDTFVKNNQDHIDSGKIIPLRMVSMEAVKLFMTPGVAPVPDMVFIDGSHDFQNVHDDIMAWSKIIKPGGLFCGHDMQWPGVTEARRVMLPPHMTGIGSIWALDNFTGLQE